MDGAGVGDGRDGLGIEKRKLIGSPVGGPGGEVGRTLRGPDASVQTQTDTGQTYL